MCEMVVSVRHVLVGYIPSRCVSMRVLGAVHFTLYADVEVRQLATR